MKHLLIVLLSLLFLSCNSNPTTNRSCPNKGILDQQRFDKITNPNHSVYSADIENGCLTLSIQAGGCSGSTWKTHLIGSESIVKTGIPKRYIKIELINEELCQALIIKEYSFDLSSFQVDNGKTILLLDRWEHELIYD